MIEKRIVNDPNIINLLRISIYVTKLFLKNCQNLQDISALSKLFQLKSLNIENCPNVTSFEVFKKI